MAWQLIYTSAPRLLEAGRTGFGTVARHRGVSALVASAVERISQFARLSGLDSRRVIYSHRIVTVGAGQFHILSCIRDAGSDYTGRTNHLAHHLIAEAREVAALKGQGPSPADVLLQMTWAQTWTSTPRFFDPSEEVPLAGFSPESQGLAWETVTGRNDFAWLPQDPRMRRGCYIITPSAADARELFHDSLACLPGESWATTFTTSLEPNDEVADFRWIALPQGSPLRPQLDTSARTILNLTNPSTLPEPERVAESESRAVSTAIREPSVERLNRPIPSLPPPAAVETRSPIPMATAMGTMGDWAPAPTKRKKPLFWVIFGAGMLCAVAVIALAMFPSIKGLDEGRMAAHIQDTNPQTNKQVDELFKGLNHLEQTRGWLKKPENKGEIEHYKKVKLWITEQSSAPDQSQAPSAAELKLQPEFQLYLDAFVGWRDETRTKSNGETLEVWRNSPPNQILNEARVWLNDIEAKKRMVQKYVPTAPRLIEDKLSNAIQQRLSEIKTATAKPQGNAKEWDDLVQFLDKKNIIKKGSDDGWIRDWARLSDLDGKKKLDDNDRKKISDLILKSGPPWLQNEARKISDKADKLAETESKSEKTPQAAAPSGKPKKSLDDAASGHPIQIEIADLPSSKGLKVVALNEVKKMHLLIGQAGNLEGRLETWTDDLKSGQFGKNGFGINSISVEADQLQLPQNSSQKSWRIIGVDKSSGKVIFELIVISPDSAAAESNLLSLTSPVPASITTNDGVSKIDAQAMSIIKQLSVPSGSSFIITTQNTEFEFNTNGTLSPPKAENLGGSSMKEITSLQEEIKNRNKSIERLRKDLEPLVNSKRASDADTKAKIEAQISKKEAEQKQQEEMLQSLILNSNPQTRSATLEAGRHRLYLKVNGKMYPMFDLNIL